MLKTLSILICVTEHTLKKPAFKVLKGSSSKKNSELDSTWPDKRTADARCAQLRKGLRGNKARTCVWVEEATDEDPVAYQKPIKGPYTGYNK